MEQLTKEKRFIQGAVFKLWASYNDNMSQEERNLRAQDFIDEHLIEPTFNTDDPFIRHPMIGRKRHLSRVTVYDVLADYVMHTSYAMEKDEEYIVHNRDQLAYREQNAPLSIMTEGQAEDDENYVRRYGRFIVTDDDVGCAIKIS